MQNTGAGPQSMMPRNHRAGPARPWKVLAPTPNSPAPGCLYPVRNTKWGLGSSWLLFHLKCHQKHAGSAVGAGDLRGGHLQP